MSTPILSSQSQQDVCCAAVVLLSLLAAGVVVSTLNRPTHTVRASYLKKLKQRSVSCVHIVVTSFKLRLPTLKYHNTFFYTTDGF